MLELRDGTRMNNKRLTYSHKSNNKLINAKLEHFWCMDKPQANTNS
jgi:hypothetical protein